MPPLQLIRTVAGRAPLLRCACPCPAPPRCVFGFLFSTPLTVPPSLTRRATHGLTAAAAQHDCSPTLVSQRHKSFYSVPLRTRTVWRSAKTTKRYNYLTRSRLATPQKQRMSVAVERRRDDVNLARRDRFKEQLLRDVEEKIRFFPSFVKKQVFFPSSRTHGRMLLFRGHRDLGISVAMRVTCLVIEQLKKAENRPFLIERMKELGVETPTAAAWAKFTDAATGNVNVGVLYSMWTESMIRSFAKTAMEAKTTEQLRVRGLVTLRDYVAVNIGDPTLVPPLEAWAGELGPLCEADFTGRSRGSATRRVQDKVKVKEVCNWGKSHVFDAVSALSLEEQMALITAAGKNRQQLLKELEERNLFASKFLQVLYSLDEMKAITKPLKLYHGFLARKHTIEHHGAYFPSYNGNTKRGVQLSKEEKARLCAFGYRHEPSPTTGQKLYLRYCVRDYGMTLSEAARRYNRLTELQRAALCFPFYLPIAPQSPSAAAFKRFYRAMCSRYGLVNSSGPVLSNRLFQTAMRKRWMAMSLSERAEYEEVDRISQVFPLVKPSARDDAGEDASQESTASATATMGEYFTENHERRSSSLDELLVSAKLKEREEEERVADDDADDDGDDWGSTSAAPTPVATAARPRAPPRHAAAASSSATAPTTATATARAPREATGATETRQKYEGLRVIMM
ncbi:hypothetical protein NQL31_006529 [Lotmaria passim]